VESSRIVKALGALAQETRLAIFRLLVEHGPAGLPVGRIGNALGLAPATLSFHLKELAQAGLVTPRPDGRYIYYRTDFGAINEVIAYLTENCCSASGACDPSCALPNRAESAGLLPSSKPTIHPKWRFA
jgi:DNA-binding transcriptional ArsR family regulator